jgi:hypothetical protein
MDVAGFRKVTGAAVWIKTQFRGLKTKLFLTGQVFAVIRAS